MYKDLETLNGPLKEVLLLIKVLVCMYRINCCCLLLCFYQDYLR